MPTWDTERYRPVKSELRVVLSDRRWHSHAELISKMLAAGDLAPRTCANLLRELARDWGVEVKGAYLPGGPGGKDTREYRLVDQRGIEAQTKVEALAALERDIRRLEHRRAHQNKILTDAAAEVASLTKEINEMNELRRTLRGGGT